jgi:hypothetical protein
MKDVKSYNEWLNENLVDKIKNMFKITETPSNEEEGDQTDSYYWNASMFGVKMHQKIKIKIIEICDFIDTLDNEDSREGWKEDVNLIHDLMLEYGMGEGSSYDSLFAAWIRDEDMTMSQQLFVLDTFLNQLKLIADFNKNAPEPYKGSIEVFKLWIITHKTKSFEQFLRDSRGTVAGYKFGL